MVFTLSDRGASRLTIRSPRLAGADFQVKSMIHSSSLLDRRNLPKTGAGPGPDIDEYLPTRPRHTRPALLAAFLTAWLLPSLSLARPTLGTGGTGPLKPVNPRQAGCEIN